MWELGHKEGWGPKNYFELWCWRRLLRIPWTAKEIQPVHPKGNQSWMFIGRTDAEAKAPVLWPPDAKSWLIGKDPDAGKDWRQEEKGMTEDEMVGWHHWLDGHEFEQALGGGEGQGSLACGSPWDHRVAHYWVTEQQQQGKISNQWVDYLINGIWLTRYQLVKNKIHLNFVLVTR